MSFEGEEFEIFYDYWTHQWNFLGGVGEIIRTKGLCEALSELAKSPTDEAHDIIFHHSPCNIDEYDILRYTCKITGFEMRGSIEDTVFAIGKYLASND